MKHQTFIYRLQNICLLTDFETSADWELWFYSKHKVKVDNTNCDIHLGDQDKVDLFYVSSSGVRPLDCKSSP